MSNQAAHDELSAAVFGVLEGLTPLRKANFLLEHVMALIDTGKCVFMI